MGRELKRVPMDFDWPQHRVWKGYLNPYAPVSCPYCYDNECRESSGYTKEAYEYEKTFYGFKISGGYYLPNPYDRDKRYCPLAKPYSFERWEYEYSIENPELKRVLYANGEIPTYEDIKEYFLKNDPFISSSYIYLFTLEYCRRNGYEVACPHCNGERVVFLNDEIKRLHEEFEKIDPPTGEGYQLWETTSEGSPISPVFASIDELAVWCEGNATIFGYDKMTKEDWKAAFEKEYNQIYYEKDGVVYF